MKFSEVWLREWVNPAINNIELIQQLTMIGFKVNVSQPISNIFYGIVIGKIIECKIHPNYDNYWIIKVNNGEKKLLNIICNAENCRKNIKVVVAKIGATLPNGNKIKLDTIQEQQSEGILCTFKILNIIDNTPGIIELPEDAPIGQCFYNYLSLYDNIMDIDITPNRGDCLSIIGIAREIAVINTLKLKQLKIHVIKPTINNTLSIIVNNPDACPKYLTRIIKNINIATPTPLWIKEKLRRCGICIINIVTDITNYVLIELGYPIHVFDYEKIEGDTIQIRYNKIAETITLSKNKIIKLKPNTLIIADNKKILSIAGIIISENCAVYSQTHDIILQSAFFTPSIIAAQSKAYNIYTLCAIRYARGVDPNISQLALERVTSLLLKYCKGYPGPIINITNNNFLPKINSITLHLKKLYKILGFYITKQKIIDILKSLGFQIEFLQKNDSWKILHPTWRFDISIEENIIAEIIRIYGYDKIPKITIKTNLITSYNHTSTISLSTIKSLLVARNYQEIITYSFVNPKTQKLLYPKKNPWILKNPITSEMSSMRLSLWIGLIETMIYNQNRQQKHIKLFESGICFIPNNNDNHQIHQTFMIAGLRSGFRFSQHWDLTTHEADFYDIKGDVEALLHYTNKFNCIKFKQSTHPALHPTQNAAIYLNNHTCIGYVGVIHPAIQSALNIRSHILVFELTWHLIAHTILPKISEISKFPKNCRDISIIVEKNISSASIINTCKKILKNQLIDVRISDVYKNYNIPENCKSLTIKLFLQSTTHTLREEEISNIVDTCITTLQKKFSITLR